MHPKALTRFQQIAWVSLCLATQCWAADGVPAAKPAIEKPALSLENPEVRKVVRESARQNIVGFRLVASEPRAQEIPATKVAATFRLASQSLRRSVAMECRMFDCVEYDASGKAIRTIPVPANSGVLRTDADNWLGCQSGNDMLSTFERFDSCSGIPSTSIFAR